MDQTFVDIGIRLAKAVFTKRSKKNQRNTEVHVTEAELAAMLALAAENGSRAAGGKVIVRLPPGPYPKQSMADIHCGPTEKPVAGIRQEHPADEARDESTPIGARGHYYGG